MTTQPNPNSKQLRLLQSGGVRYQETLRAGSFALVVLAQMRGKSFAIKLNSVWKVHQQEELIFKSLGCHPNVVRYYGSWSNRNLQAIRMAYIEGTSLLDVLIEKPLTEGQAHRLFRQLVLGMQHAHEARKIAHCDLKAEHLIISPDRTRLCIIDWSMGIKWSVSKTHSQTCGSLSYAAPEICQRKPYKGPELDIWSMGVILYGMVTGDFPFTGASDTETAYRIVRGDYPEPRVSVSLCNLISRMLTVSQTHRITINEILTHPWVQVDRVGNLSYLSTYSSSGHSLRPSQWRADVFVPTAEQAAKKFGKRHPTKRKASSHIRSRRGSRAQKIPDIECPTDSLEPATQIQSDPCFSALYQTP